MTAGLNKEKHSWKGGKFRGNMCSLHLICLRFVDQLHYYFTLLLLQLHTKIYCCRVALWIMLATRFAKKEQRITNG